MFFLSSGFVFEGMRRNSGISYKITAFNLTLYSPNWGNSNSHAQRVRYFLLFLITVQHGRTFSVCFSCCGWNADICTKVLLKPRSEMFEGNIWTFCTDDLNLCRCSVKSEQNNWILPVEQRNNVTFPSCRLLFRPDGAWVWNQNTFLRRS